MRRFLAGLVLMAVALTPGEWGLPGAGSALHAQPAREVPGVTPADLVSRVKLRPLPPAPLPGEDPRLTVLREEAVSAEARAMKAMREARTCAASLDGGSQIGADERRAHLVALRIPGERLAGAHELIRQGAYGQALEELEAVQRLALRALEECQRGP